jgi:hypothetical protein
MLGLSMRGTHIHSTFPFGAINAQTSVSEMNPYSSISGNGLAAGADWDHDEASEAVSGTGVIAS